MMSETASVMRFGPLADIANPAAQGQTAAEAVHADLRRAILTLELRPDVPLRIKSLCACFAIGPTRRARRFGGRGRRSGPRRTAARLSFHFVAAPRHLYDQLQPHRAFHGPHSSADTVGPSLECFSQLRELLAVPRTNHNGARLDPYYSSLYGCH